MPAVVNISLSSVADVSRALGYFGDASHPNHRFHEIEKPLTVGAKDVSDFVERVARGIEFLNLCADPRNGLRVAGRWWVFAFAKGSFLCGDEEADYLSKMVTSVGCRKFYASSWHRGLNGSSDLNIFDSGFDFDDVPMLRRSRYVNLLARTRHRSDEWAKKANYVRAGAGHRPMPTVVEKQFLARRARGVITLEDLLLSTLRRWSQTKLTVETLPTIMAAAGLQRADWEIDLNNRLLVFQIPRRKKYKKNGPLLRLGLSVFLAEINLLLCIGSHEKYDSKAVFKTGDAMETNKDVIRRLRTTLAVLQDHEVPLSH